MKNDWGLELGTYPGLLFGARTYEYPDNKEAEVIDYVLYIPFIMLIYTTINYGKENTK